MSQAKLKITMGKATIGDKDVKIAISISKKDFFKNAEFFENCSGEIEAQLGDPQMTLEEYAKQQGLKPMTGTSYTVAPSGTVEGVKKDDDQPDLFEQRDEAEPFEVEGDEPAEDAEDGDSTEEESEECLEFGETSYERDYNESAPEKETGEIDEVALAAIGKEELEEYILSERPTFEDIPYDFPALLERKKAGETWLKIAGSFGKSTGHLQAVYSEYKNRVKKQMAGAAS